MMKLFRLLLVVSLLSSATSQPALAKKNDLKDHDLNYQPAAAGQGNSNPQEKPENDSQNALGFFQDRLGDVLDSVFSYVITAAASASVGYFWRRAAQKNQLKFGCVHEMPSAENNLASLLSQPSGNSLNNIYESYKLLAELVLHNQPSQTFDSEVVELFIVCEGGWSICQQLTEFYRRQWCNHPQYKLYSGLEQAHDDAVSDGASSDRAAVILDLTNQMRLIEDQNEFYRNYKRFEGLNEKLESAILLLKKGDSSQLSHPPTRWERLAGHYGVVGRAEHFAKVLIGKRENKEVGAT
jgi:hypothetical protein